MLALHHHENVLLAPLRVADHTCLKVLVPISCLLANVAQFRLGDVLRNRTYWSLLNGLGIHHFVIFFDDSLSNRNAALSWF